MLSDRLLRIRDVVDQVGFSASQIRLWIRRGVFPAPIHVFAQPTMARWSERAVQEWIAEARDAGRRVGPLSAASDGSADHRDQSRVARPADGAPMTTTTPE